LSGETEQPVCFYLKSVDLFIESEIHRSGL